MDELKFNLVPSIACESSARLLCMYIINFKNIIIMDNVLELYYDSLEEQYLRECAKFNVGDVVYFEYKETEGISADTSVGVIIDRGTKKIFKSTANKESVLVVICYDIITPHRTFKSISECKICSASEFIYHEYLKNQAR